ncbi:MAG: rod shape-determining protein MreC [Armatimonadetes bacterium]|nr:rod shape-determining protein MreC [Armatimonadota bacterium]
MNVRRGIQHQQLSVTKAFFGGVIFSIMLLVFAFSGRNFIASLLNALRAGTVSAISAVSYLLDSVTSLPKQFFPNAKLQSELKQLRFQLAELQAESLRIQELTEENRRLRQLLGLAENVGQPYIAAEVIAIGGSNWFHTFIINKGSKDGIIQGAPVLCHKGLVGRVWEVRNYHSVILLITDRHSAVGVSLTEHEGVHGILKGTGKGLCELAHLSRHVIPKKGETLVTSGLGGVFPKGISVGEVVSVKIETEPPTVKVKPLFRPDELREVIVLTKLPPIVNQ